MRAFGVRAGLLLALLHVASCAPVIVPLPTIERSTYSAKGAAVVHQSILRALQRHRYPVVHESDGQIIALVKHRGRTARVAIQYKSTTFQVVHLSSQDLGYSQRGGKAYIAESYVRLVDVLATDIDREVSRAPMPAPYVPPAVIATAPPTPLAAPPQPAPAAYAPPPPPGEMAPVPPPGPATVVSLGASGPRGNGASIALERHTPTQAEPRRRWSLSFSVHGRDRDQGGSTYMPPTCEESLENTGHGQAGSIFCEGAEPYCAQALLEAGHSPTLLDNCRGVELRCAVTLLEQGHHPFQLSNCHNVDGRCAEERLRAGHSPFSLSMWCD